jgi:hypothetical protein
MVVDKILAFLVDVHFVLSRTLDPEMIFQRFRELLQVTEMSLMGAIKLMLVEVPKNVWLDILRTSSRAVRLQDASV